MKARQFKQDSTTTHSHTATNSYVAEALAKQAAMRPKKSPPKVLPVTPTLKKMPRPTRFKKAK